MSSKRVKTNPRRIPVTKADLEKAKTEAREEAVRIAWSIFFTVLRDKHGATIEELRQFWDEVNELSDSIAKGYCTVADLRQILREEAGANID